MPEFFTPIRIELLENAFALVDVDHGGTLDLNEVTTACWQYFSALVGWGCIADQYSNIISACTFCGSVRAVSGDTADKLHCR